MFGAVGGRHVAIHLFDFRLLSVSRGLSHNSRWRISSRSRSSRPSAGACDKALLLCQISVRCHGKAGLFRTLSVSFIFRNFHPWIAIGACLGDLKLVGRQFPSQFGPEKITQGPTHTSAYDQSACARHCAHRHRTNARTQNRMRQYPPARVGAHNNVFCAHKPTRARAHT